jgi:RNA polymerase sigma-70 factor (ECF subfamily)
MITRADLPWGRLLLASPSKPESDTGKLRSDPSALSVATLIERAHAGDRAAFGVLVARYERKVLTTTWRYLRNREDAMDAAQETFLRVHKYLRGFNVRDDFGAWIYRIAINVSCDMAAARGKRQQFEADSEKEETRAVDDALDPEQASAARAAQVVFEQALKSLSPKERAAYVMRDLDGASTAAVALALDASMSTVRVHICMARRKIWTALRAAGHGDLQGSGMRKKTELDDGDSDEGNS